ncbi:hypothetical protein J31TS4_10650 [Paenibacillus sp. J31TS4]|uniref:glycerophosphodiester phosphodiesterase family protein n=1 Tax=Paenibacillus sp. J31TS4 TaxID=2807195 RepID=UPI001B11430C|nr:glycerophosphodiester phosphodiesterase family protein [Paenibacillus sp. J31TS4]GIP37785.1 hypothetical protein J31TS4_10650 [Paenibacillus sp. J31TS4]
MIEQLLQPAGIVVSAHRGYKARYPENTLLAFQKALELEVDMIEFDLRFSKDGEVVVIHDETVDRTTDGTGRVSDMTLEELKRLDAGGWFGKPFEGLKIPTLAELCELLSGYPRILLNVEIKPAPDATRVADASIALLGEHGLLPNCVFTCFDATVSAYLFDTYGVKVQGFPEHVMYNYVPGPEGTRSKLWAVAASMSLLTPQLVKEIEEAGLLAWCYCPDRDQQVHYALGCGVKVMTVNDPLPAMRIRKQLNQSVEV